MSPLAAYVVETVVTLLAIAVLAVLVLYGARRVGIGRPSGPLSLLGRLPLDGRRAVYLVRAGQRVFVVGASEAGLAKLGEIDGDGLEIEAPETPLPFAGAFAKVLKKGRAKKPAAPNAPSDGDEDAA